MSTAMASTSSLGQYTPSGRRPSAIKRKPVPQLSTEELALLASMSTPAFAPSTSSSPVALPSLKAAVMSSSLSATNLPSVSSPPFRTSVAMSVSYSDSPTTFVPNDKYMPASSTPSKPRQQPKVTARNFYAPRRFVSAIPVKCRNPSVASALLSDCGCLAEERESASDLEGDDGDDASSESSDSEPEEISQSTLSTSVEAYKLSNVWIPRAPELGQIPPTLPRLQTSTLLTYGIPSEIEVIDPSSKPRPSISSSVTALSSPDSLFDRYDARDTFARSFRRTPSTVSSTATEAEELEAGKAEPDTIQTIVEEASEETSAVPADVESETERSGQPVSSTAVTNSDNPAVDYTQVLKQLKKQARRSSNRVRSQKTSFNSFEKPTFDSLQAAADCHVIDEDGISVRFGNLFEGQRTIVCFIRHYWCPSCQDYLSSIMRVTPAQLRALNLKLVVIGCGSPQMIAGYRKALGGCTYPIFSDPTRAIYKHFGMTRTSLSPGKPGPYIQHGMLTNTMISLKRNMAMPVKNPGPLAGLGGEFVIGPDLTCSFAHRMKATRDHAELEDILKAIGVVYPADLFPERVQADKPTGASTSRRTRIGRHRSSETPSDATLPSSISTVSI